MDIIELYLLLSANALDFIFANQIFRNNRFTSESGIPAKTASRFTLLILDRDFIKPLNKASGRRLSLYSFEHLLKLVRV